MTLKNATHIGVVEFDGFGLTSRQATVWLRETPKTWTDGKYRWKKINRFGVKEPRLHASRGNSRYGATLHVDTIRPLMAADLRAPLKAELDHAGKALEHLKGELAELQKREQAANNRLLAAHKALAAFDEVHAGELCPAENEMTSDA